MKLSTLIADDAAPSAPERDHEITGLTADSREVEPGFVFAALRGVKADGARFVPDALAAGAVAILADQDTVLDAPGHVAIVRAGNPRRALARIAARFYDAQPEMIAAVTGTNGKTSVASFLRQLWTGAGHRAASLGTLGIVAHGKIEPLTHTSPDPVALHRMLARLTGEGISHMAIEASSHGLAQYRLDGVRLSAGAFTNLSRDHLDYHADTADYFAAKARLFSELLPSGAAAVLNAEAVEAGELARIARDRGLDVATVGRGGDLLALKSVGVDAMAQIMTIEAGGTTHHIRLPLVGGFQVSNALVAAGLAIVTGMDQAKALAGLEHLEGARGRLEQVAAAPAPVFIDYAHTPAALETALQALRPFARGSLAVVFGCGGDRDRGKRALMGQGATRLADRVYVTDDNPRTEIPAAIRAEIMAAAPGAIEIGDRAQAIATAIEALAAGDILLVAGKGHETGQIIGEETRPFSDHDVVRDMIARLEGNGA